MIYFYLIVNVLAPHAKTSDRKKFTSGKFSFKGGENTFFKIFSSLRRRHFGGRKEKGSAAGRNRRGACNLPIG